MYFKDRKEAGLKLAEQIVPKYQGENSVVLALNNGGVVVGAEIAMQLHCGVTLLLTAPITLPREPDPLAAVDQEGGFTYNSMFSSGEIEEYTSEYHNYIEQEKLEEFHKINHILSADGVMPRDMLHRHHVILVADGFPSGFALDAAANYLKPVRLKKLIVAAPIASVQATDRMHMLADDIYCLGVLENYMNTDHYYDEGEAPNHETAVKIMAEVPLNWK